MQPGNLRPAPLEPSQLAALGLHAVAYVKPATIDGTKGFAIHAADGTRIGFAPSLALAVAAIRRNELEPASVH